VRELAGLAYELPRIWAWLFRTQAQRDEEAAAKRKRDSYVLPVELEPFFNANEVRAVDEVRCLMVSFGGQVVGLAFKHLSANHAHPRLGTVGLFGIIKVCPRALFFSAFSSLQRSSRASARPFQWWTRITAERSTVQSSPQSSAPSTRTPPSRLASSVTFLSWGPESVSVVGTATCRCRGSLLC